MGVLAVSSPPALLPSQRVRARVRRVRSAAAAAVWLVLAALVVVACARASAAAASSVSVCSAAQTETVLRARGSLVLNTTDEAVGGAEMAVAGASCAFRFRLDGVVLLWNATLVQRAFAASPDSVCDASACIVVESFGAAGDIEWFSAGSVGVPATLRAQTIVVTFTNYAGGDGAFRIDYAVSPLPSVQSVTPSSGPFEGGNRVTLTGSFFSGVDGGVTRVLFGSEPASALSVVSDGIIVLSAPSRAAGGAGGVSITLSTAGGTNITTSTQSYTYNTRPVVAQVQPSVGLVYGTADVVLTIDGTALSSGSDVQSVLMRAPDVAVDGVALQQSATRVVVSFSAEDIDYLLSRVGSLRQLLSLVNVSIVSSAFGRSDVSNFRIEAGAQETLAIVLPSVLVPVAVIATIVTVVLVRRHRRRRRQERKLGLLVDAGASAAGAAASGAASGVAGGASAADGGTGGAGGTGAGSTGASGGDELTAVQRLRGAAIVVGFGTDLRAQAKAFGAYLSRKHDFTVYAPKSVEGVVQDMDRFGHAVHAHLAAGSTGAAARLRSAAASGSAAQHAVLESSASTSSHPATAASVAGSRSPAVGVGSGAAAPLNSSADVDVEAALPLVRTGGSGASPSPSPGFALRSTNSLQHLTSGLSVEHGAPHATVQAPPTPTQASSSGHAQLIAQLQASQQQRATSCAVLFVVGYGYVRNGQNMIALCGKMGPGGRMVPEGFPVHELLLEFAHKVHGGRWDDAVVVFDCCTAPPENLLLPGDVEGLLPIAPPPGLFVLAAAKRPDDASVQIFRSHRIKWPVATALATVYSRTTTTVMHSALAHVAAQISKYTSSLIKPLLSAGPSCPDHIASSVSLDMASASFAPLVHSESASQQNNPSGSFNEARRGESAADSMHSASTSSAHSRNFNATPSTVPSEAPAGGAAPQRGANGTSVSAVTPVLLESGASGPGVAASSSTHSQAARSPAAVASDAAGVDVSVVTVDVSSPKKSSKKSSKAGGAEKKPSKRKQRLAAAAAASATAAAAAAVAATSSSDSATTTTTTTTTTESSATAARSTSAPGASVAAASTTTTTTTTTTSGGAGSGARRNNGGSNAAAASSSMSAALQARRTEIASTMEMFARWNIPANEVDAHEIVGRGSFGDVYRGELWGIAVAVKVVRHVSRSALEGFKSEVELLSSVRHPNVILFIGTAVSDDQLLIITEYAANGSLYALLRDRRDRLTPAIRMRFAVGIARGMLYLHSRQPKIIHRDLKSPNILVDEHWNAKVADFGLSKFKEASFAHSMVGSPAWVAPEVLLQQPYTESCDVFSFGVLLWEIMTGRLPLEGKPAYQVLAARLGGDRVIDLTVLPPWCPPEMADLLERCTSATPSARPEFSAIVTSLTTMEKAVVLAEGGVLSSQSSSASARPPNHDNGKSAPSSAAVSVPVPAVAAPPVVPPADLAAASSTASGTAAAPPTPVTPDV